MKYFLLRYAQLTFILTIFSGVLYAESASDDIYKKTGTSAAQFLKISVGARHQALGDSTVALVDDACSPLINPAGMGFLFSPEIQAMHALWLGDMYYDMMSYVHPTTLGSFGVSAQYLSGPDLDRIVQGVKKDKFKTYDAAGNISYSKSFRDIFSAGINAKVIQSRLADESASTGACDIGIKVKTPHDFFSFGLVGQHIGGTMKFIDTADQLPTVIRSGFSFQIDLPEHYSLFNLTMQANMPRDYTPYYSVGIEHIGGKLFVLRFGYTLDPTENNLNVITHWRTGMGFNIKNFIIDYAYRPFDVLGNAHVLSMSWRFSQFGYQKTKLSATLRADPAIFSPNSDGVKDTSFLIPSLPSDMQNVNKWNIDIRDGIGALVKTMGGEEMLPSILSWDGRNEENVIMANGEYTAILRARGDNRLEAESPEENIIIDVSPPDVSLVLSSPTFSPNGDGIDDTVDCIINGSDIHGIARWQLTITNNQGKFVHVIKSTETLPLTVAWNGKDDYYNIIVPNGYYDIQFFVWDEAGNRNTSQVNSVNLKYEKEFKNIEVKKGNRGLTVNLTSSVLFTSGRAMMNPESQKALDELVELLKSYPENEVAIEGHSDSVGSNQSNLELSSKRAWMVYSYLVKNGIDPKRLKPKGIGEAKPIASNRTEAGREKNRRVEIIILKTGTE